MTNEIQGFDPLAYTNRMHKFIVREAINNLRSIRNKKVDLPIVVLEDLLLRLEENKTNG